MAEVALTSIAKSALHLFISLAKDELLLQWKSQQELERLEDSIETISCYLQDADKLQSKDNSVQNILSRLRLVMYDADDLFDALASKALHENTLSGCTSGCTVSFFFTKPPKLFSFKTAHEVKAIRESLDGIKDDMTLCGFVRQTPQPLENPQVMRFNRGKTHSFVHEEDVVGRDEDRDRVIHMLLPPQDNNPAGFSVVTVIGFGGLGKTTLAQLVYNNDRVTQGFDLCLWACINDLSDLEQVLIEIIASKEGRRHDLGLEKLQGKLRKIIGGKKFLLVLDDVWDDKYVNWLRLETILQCGKVGSKVLVTTRSIKVAESLKAPMTCRFELEVLQEESAWSLFVKKAFREVAASEYPELEEVGKKIVVKCRNVPLAIITIGSLLYSKKRDVRTWSNFLENELGKVLSSSDGGIKDVLMVSYNDLHPNLRLCFSYCSLFPKDFRFRMDKLIYSWISQGFVKPNLEGLEEEGEAYFFHLVDKCFFHEVRKYHDVDNHLYTYSAKIHDLLHDVAIDVAKIESKFLDKDLINKGERISARHISVYCEADASFNYCNLVIDPNVVRTLILNKILVANKISQGSLDMLLASFRSLRTLSLSGLEIKILSDSIGGLIHLRFLDLSRNENLKHLPNSICKIHHLRTLILNDCTFLQKLPPKIEKLISLRQLYTSGCVHLECMPPGLKYLTSLVNLDLLVVHSQIGGLGFLNVLNNLCGVLRIELPEQSWPDATEDAKASYLSQKLKLSGLVFSWKSSSCPLQLAAKDEALGVLEALEPPENLEYLEISHYGGEKLPHWFCMLKNIKVLHLKDCDHVEYLEDEFRGNLLFPSLENLKIERLRNIKSWWRREIPEESRRTCLAKVSRVFISDCEEFQGKLPFFDGIEYLKLERVAMKLLQELLTRNPNCSMSPFGKLKTIELGFIKGLICLPERWIRHLTALQVLDISKCKDLRWVSRRGLTNLTELRVMELLNYKCEIGGDEYNDKMEIEVGMPWKALQKLEQLSILAWDMEFREGLGYLTSLKSLYVDKLEDGDFEFPTKGLQSLRIVSLGFKDGKTCDLRKIGIQNLPFLTDLSIEGCKEVHLCWKTLLGAVSLKSLTLSMVEKLIDVGDMEVERQSQLRSFSLIYCGRGAKWVHDIPWTWLASLEDLSLCIEDEAEFMEEQLPNGIQHLSSLRDLHIQGWGNVRSVPKWFPYLTSLSSLVIAKCSEELKRRCEKEKGADWPLINHISDHIEISTWYNLHLF